MIEKVGEILKQLKIPVKYIIRPGLDPEGRAISYSFYGERYAYYGDGEGKDFIVTMQLDIFYRKDLAGVDRQIIEILKQNKIRFENSFDSIESLNGVRLYHKVMTFNFLESEVRD